MTLIALFAGLCAASGQSLRFLQSEIDLGTIADTVAVRPLVLEFENVGDRAVELTQVRTSCSCLSARVSETRLEPGEKGHLTLSFNPYRMVGEVAVSAGICLDGNVLADSEVLLKAKVEISDRWYYLPVRVGGLALKRDKAMAPRGEVTRIICANITSQALSPSVEVQTEGIAAWFEPSEIAPESEADLVIRVGADCRENAASIIVLVGEQRGEIVLNFER